MRRNPLVVLLCLELMLNAGNLALIGFARMWNNGDGQIFAIVVMVVAACEVAHRPRHHRRAVPPAPADRRRRAAGAARLRLQTPPGSSCSCRSPARSSSPSASASGRRGSPAASARSRSPLASSSRSSTFFTLQDRRRGGAQVVSRRRGTSRTSPASTASSAILVDPLAVFMALVVTGVSTLIHLYSVAYMSSDRGYTRFFAYLNFFVFSMLLLVLAGNFVLLIVGWAFVGAASLPADLVLVPAHDRDVGGHQGVRHQRASATSASCSARSSSSAHRARSTSWAPSTRRQKDFAENDPGALIAGLILLLVGAFAKSAQVPLHTWLPDAMEGPTPVSALIHAATMVTAGVYLIARLHPLFECGPDRRRRRRDHRRADAADRRHDRPRRDRPQARHRLLDDVPDRLHDHGRVGRRLRRPGSST